MANKTLSKAKKAKNDEFYTQLTDIENELKHYKRHFEGKTVLCNCDDPRVSNFFRYFTLNFEHLKLKRLICTCYKNQDIDLFTQNRSEKAVYTIYEGDRNGNKKADKEEIRVVPLKGDGDFRSDECKKLLQEADIVVTNPPFSLLHEYVMQLVEYNKKFLIMCNHNIVHYKGVFPLIKENKVWLGYNSNKTIRFAMPENYEKWDEIIDGTKYGKVPSISWLTNLDIEKRHENLILYKKYNDKEYVKYDNFDAININQISDIPYDWEGMMGVPDTFLDIYNPEQFEIIGMGSGTLAKEIGVKRNYRGRTDIAYTDTNGEKKCPFSRIIIKKK